jgi:hypothetical protein
MRIPILVEPTSGNRFRAVGCQPFAGSVEAESPEAALATMRKLIDERVSQGARIVSLELPGGSNPWLEGAGMFRDDPLYGDWQRAMADYRREANENADEP